MSDVVRKDLYRVCVKLYTAEPPHVEDDAKLFVPIFHDWIRDGALDLVLLDVADYAHAPDSPGIMLISYEINFALDRSDGRFGLFAQRRARVDGDAVDAIASTLRHALDVAARLEADPRVAGKLSFDPAALRVEANDRLLAPNTDAGYAAFEPLVRAAAARVFDGRELSLARVDNDPRDRLAVDVLVAAGAARESVMA